MFEALDILLLFVSFYFFLCGKIEHLTSTETVFTTWSTFKCFNFHNYSNELFHYFILQSVLKCTFLIFSDNISTNFKLLLPGSCHVRKSYCLCLLNF